MGEHEQAFVRAFLVPRYRGFAEAYGPARRFYVVEVHERDS